MLSALKEYRPPVVHVRGAPAARRIIAAEIAENARAALGRRRLHVHLKNIWHVVEPGTPFKDNWHLGAICEHLEAVSSGELTRLLINMPPRSLKSIMVSIAWMTWEWINAPWLRYIFSSYAAQLSTRDSLKCRMVIASNFYQNHYGTEFSILRHQDEKTRFMNDKLGLRLATSVGGLGTGEGGDRLVVDDPHNVLETESDVQRKEVLRWWTETMSTRYNDPEKGAAVIVMQRIHHNDLAGLVLEQGGWEHLLLPMEFEEGCGKTTSLGFKDPRTKEGELLHPARMSADSLTRLKRELGTHGVAGQLQQRPVPRGGAIFKRANFGTYRELPKFSEVIISVDCAFKDTDTSDYVAIQVWGRIGPRKYLVHRIRDHLGFGATVLAIRSVLKSYPTYLACVIEDKANGTAVVETLQQKVPRVLAVNPEGGKLARAYAIEPDQEAGDIFLPDPELAPWIEEWLAEVTTFPASPHDDEVDAFTQAITWFRTRDGSMGFLAFAREELERLAQEQTDNAPA